MARRSLRYLRNFRGQTRGATLIEVMIALALTGVVLTAAGAQLLQSYQDEAAFRQQNGVQQNARRAVDYIADDMKGAERAVTTLTINGAPAAYPTDTVMGASIGSVASPLSTNPYSTANNISSSSSPLYFNIFDDNGAERRVRYWLTGTDLWRQVVPYIAGTTTVAAAPSDPNYPPTLIARNVKIFFAQKPYDVAAYPASPNYNIVRIVIAVTDGDQPTNLASTPPTGQSRAVVQADVTLRNNLL